MMMAYSSSSSANLRNIPQIKYDVFLSFRGEDTRNNFISHLYAALCRMKIEAFIDNQLRKGDEISQSLLDAIEASMISVVIFSKDYASSSWCLDELVKILECKNKYGRIVIPIFHHVDPSNVRNQTGVFGDGFMKLIDQQKRFQEKLQQWRFVLTDAGKISGFHLNGDRFEFELIEKVADYILKKLNDKFSISSDDRDHLVGLNSRVKKIESVLSMQTKDVYTLGIWGIGGIGKTTIASAVFSKISHHFEGCCFVSNVRGEEEKDRGLNRLRRELLSTLLMDQNVKIDIPNIGLNFGSRRLSRKKVLIVLDDVTCFEQIELLVGGLEFAAGSRIILTTRDKHVLNIYRVDYLYEVEKLAHDDALKLFSRHAFVQNNTDVGYEELSAKVRNYADGIPLALKVLGRFLVRRNTKEWESAINKLRKIPNMEILNVLKISYDGLDREEQYIFLDIACFLQGMGRDIVVKFLDACGFSGQIGVRVLADKSLIKISKDNTIKMHDLLQELGREIVRQEAVNDLGKRSRLWNHEDIYKILTCNTGTEAVEGISLNMSQVKELSLDPYIFTKMRKLKFLRFYGENKFRVSVYTSIFSRFFNMSYLRGPTFTELRYLEWHGYPLNTLPSTIHPEKIVSLEIPDSNIKQLWNGVQHLGNLKSLRLDGCKQLAKIPDLSLAQNLERLNLRGCISLVELHSSIQFLNKLHYLYLSGCSNLRCFPEIRSLTHLFLVETAIEKVPPSIWYLSKLVELDLSYCQRLKSLPSSLYQLKSLKRLFLIGCSNLQRLSNETEKLEASKNLDGSEMAIREAPLSFARLSGIKGHKPLAFLSYDGLHGLNCLKYLFLGKCGIKELPENIFECHLSSLEFLFLDGNNFKRIPESIIHLSKLEDLTLSHCKRLKFLPELPRGLLNLDADNCTSLESLSGLSFLFKSDYSSWLPTTFNFVNCLKLDRDELNKIANDVLHILQLNVTIWYDEVRDQACCCGLIKGPTGHIYFPGSEIPEWFRYRSTGSSITVKLPPGCFNKNFPGFALCVIVPFQHHPKSFLRVRCECNLKIKDGYCANVLDVIFIVGHASGFVGSDHVILAYDFNKYPEGFGKYYDNNEAIFQFYIEDAPDGHTESCVVIKKCGIHLFYAQDFGESAAHYTEIHALDGEEQHPKRLKFSTSPLQESAYLK